MKKIFSTILLLLLLIGCTPRKRLLPDYKGWVVIGKEEIDFLQAPLWKTMWSTGFQGYPKTYVTIQNGYDVKEIQLYDIDWSQLLGHKPCNLLQHL